MALTYYDVMQANLSTLLEASKMWKKMGGRFGELHGDYKENVKILTDEGGAWTGVGSDSYREKSEGTLHEYLGAKKQANAIGKLLEDAYHQLTDLKKKVEKIRDDATAAGIKVDEYGGCKFDFSDYTPLEKRAAIQGGGFAEEENQWMEKIRSAVKKVADADQGVQLALTSVTKDKDGKGDSSGFNSDALGDVEKYEGLRAANLAMRLNSGEELSDGQLSEFQRLNRDNAGNAIYSRTVLNDLGPEATVKLSNNLVSRAHASGSDSRKQYLSLEKGLSAVLATATMVEGSDKKADRQFRDEWLTDIKKIGAEKFPGPLGDDHQIGEEEQKVRGYQSILTLIEHGDPEAYSAGFLQALGQDVYETERASQGSIWDLNQSYAGEDMEWFANDPMDSALGLMAEHPDAATEFLDPGVGGDNNKLDYLINERDWNGIIPVNEEWHGNTSTFVEGDPREDSDARRGFGAALEAAATGHEPLQKGESGGSPGPHSAAQARVLQEAINCFDLGPELERGNRNSALYGESNPSSQSGFYGQEVPENVRKNLARSLADYVPDTYAILSEQGGNYDSPRGGEVWTDSDGNSGVNVNKASLMRVMRGASEDPEAYTLLYETNQRFAAQQLGEAPQKISPGDKEWLIAAHEAGSSIGVMNAIGADVIYDERDSRASWAADVQRYSYHGIGAPITGIPVIGDFAQRSVDAIGYEWQKDVTEAATEKANTEGSRQYSAGISGTYRLFERFAEQRDIPTSAAEDTGYENHPLHGEWKAARIAARGAYADGRTDAENNLGWN